MLATISRVKAARELLQWHAELRGLENKLASTLLVSKEHEPAVSVALIVNTSDKAISVGEVVVEGDEALDIVTRRIMAVEKELLAQHGIHPDPVEAQAGPTLGGD